MKIPQLTFLISLISIAFTQTAIAANIEADSTISQVTVSQNSAIITRSGNAEVPQGQHNLIISGLPADLDLGRLRLSVADDEVVLGNLRIRRQFQQGLAIEEQQQLQAELEQLQFERRAVTDRIESARAQLKLIDTVASGSIGGQETLSSADSLENLLSTLASSANESRRVIREAEQDLAQLDRDIERIRTELTVFASRDRSTQSAMASIEAASNSNVEFTVSYPVIGPRWQWHYQARLDTRREYLEMERKVAITQATGEDWEDVELTITTSQATSNISAPEPGPVLVGLQPFISEGRPLTASAPRSLASRDQEIEEVVVTGYYLRSDVQTTATQYTVEYIVPGAVTVTSGDEQQIFSIDARGMQVDLVSRTVPELDPAAYLQARFELDDETPIYPGLMQFYRDGSFIGSRRTGITLPGDEVKLPFGKDERIRVELLPVEEETDGGGFFGRAAIEDRKQRFLITSFQSVAVDIEVIARLPVPQNSDIEIRIDGDATPADAIDIDDTPGTLLWRRELQPTVAVEINHFYEIRFPEDERLFFR